MRKLLVLILLLAAGKVAFQSFTQYRTEKNMARVAEELNKQLPQSTDFIRLEEVTYSNRVLRYSGSLLQGQELNEEFKLAAQQKVKEIYCSSQRAFADAKVSVEYAFKKTSMKSLDDKLRSETWSAVARPQDCN